MSKSLSRVLASGAIALQLVLGVAPASAATGGSWYQTEWSAGASSAVAAHPANDAGWKSFTSNALAGDAVNPPAQGTELKLGRQTWYAVDSDFNNGALSGVQKLGSGPDASLVLAQAGTGSTAYAYETTGTLPAAPGGIFEDARIVRNGSDDAAYVLQGATGDSTKFFKYSVSTGAWTTLATYGQGVDPENDIIRSGTEDAMYLVRGGYQDLVKYSVSSDSWSSLAFIPEYGNIGGLVRGGNEDFIYTVSGDPASKMFRYSISANAWTALAVAPGNVAGGAQLFRNGTDDAIYLLSGGNAGDATSKLYRYSISANAWTTLATVPHGVSFGSRVLRNGAANEIYVYTDRQNGALLRYSVSGNAWTTLATIPNPDPAATGTGADLSRNGGDNDIYLVRGSSPAHVYRYSVSANTWTEVLTPPGRIGAGAALLRTDASHLVLLNGGSQTQVSKLTLSPAAWDSSTRSITELPGPAGFGSSLFRNGSDDFVYVISGNTAFYRYSVSGNSWKTLKPLPITGRLGTTVLRNGADDAVFVLIAGSSTEGGLWKYSVSADSWTKLAASPGANVVSGATMIRDGASDAIYVDTGTKFFTYSVAGNSWTPLTNPPAAGPGFTLSHVAGEDAIYAIKGGVTKEFWWYSINAKIWTKLANTPFESDLGSHLIRQPGEDFLYFASGLGQFARYTIASSTWTTLPAPPVVHYPVNDSSAYPMNDSDLLRSGGDIFYLTTGNVLKYAIATNTWSTLPAVPGVSGYGNRFIRSAAGDFWILSGNTLLFNDPRSFWHLVPGAASGYAASGLFDSEVFALGNAADFGKITYTGLKPAGTTIVLAARTGATPTPDASWSPLGQIALDGEVGNPPPANKYIQYRIALGTNDSAVTPRVNSIRIGFFIYWPTGELVSSPYDTGSATGGVQSLSWVEQATLPTGAGVTVSLRTAPSAAGLTGAWTDFTAATAGCVKVSGTVTCNDGALASALNTGGDDRFVQYRVRLASTGAATPIVGSVTVGFSDTPVELNTFIDSKPAASTKSTSATFTFHANRAGTFECKFGSGAWQVCPSPKTFTGLTLGKHSFTVRAKDTSGLRDRTPAVYTWTVVK